MKKQLLLFVLSTVLFGAVLNAQSTFDDKKRKSNLSAKSARNTGFDVSKLKIKPKPNAIAPARKTYRIPSVFSLNGSGSLYEHKVLKASKSGIPLFIDSKPSGTLENASKSQSVETKGIRYLEDIRHMLQIVNPFEEFESSAKKTDNLGQTHLKMQQVYKGVKVYGSEVVVHLDKNGQVRSFNGRSNPTPQVNSVSPKIDFKQALAIIESDLGARVASGQPADSGFKGLLVPSESKEELVIYKIGDEDVLTRHITVFPTVIDRWEYFIDANTGRVLDKYYHTCKMHADLDGGEKTHDDRTILPPTNTSGIDLNGVTRQLSTWSNGTQNYLIDTSKPMFNAAQSELPDNPVGGIITLDLRGEAPAEGVKIFHVTSASNSWGNANGVSAHYNADISYEYFRTTFNRNSINGSGGNIISFINVGNPETGGGFDNAFWNGKAMFYGSGDIGFTPLAGALDVGGHEMSHGVIQNTANLEYRDQSGALNESFADIFGAMIDRDDWRIAEDIVTDIFPSGAMRDMQNPNNGGNQDGDIGWQPKDMSEFVVTTRDNGGVHINSGVPNRAYYLYATEIGKDKAEQVYYRALDTYLTVSSQFIDLRLAVLQSAADLYGNGSPEVQAAENAFDTVGITDGEGTDTENEIPIASGDEFILSLDIRDTDPNTLYLSDTNGNNFVPLTTTRVLRKPSVADDGSFAIYVTEDNTVNAVTLDVNNIEETEISAERIWAQVALSKDGTKLAAITNDQDNIIYISDLISGESLSFELYNPTTSDTGVVTGEVLYADALEWDYSGEYLIYDALNRIDNADGNDIDYWDVGALKVWDNQSNSFGDGTIQKLFANLPEGVSIGNPSFSKTSGNILAFDVLDANNNTYEVIAANIETGDVKTVYQNNKLGFPNYSKTDDQLIFDSFNNGDEDILAINMGADKISPSGSASELIPNGKWGIWYTVGERSTLSSEKEITDFRFNVVTPAAVGVINGSEISVNLPNNINPTNLVATFAHSSRSQVSVAGLDQQSGVTTNDFTNPLVYTVTAEDGSTKDFTVRLGANGPGPTPDDSDGDGVLNDDDLCPNTPVGSTVDVTGCEIFSLPTDNFRILAKGESCADSGNGAITVAATRNLNYVATVTGGGLNGSVNFTQTLLIEDLQAGQYNICITVQGQTDYETCFDVAVSEPQPLSVSSKVNLQANTLTLNLSGADRYFITLDNEEFTTSEAEIDLPMKGVSAKLSVRTEKECQGVYEEEIGFDSTKVVIYPNPIASGEITVRLSSVPDDAVPIQLSTLSGVAVMQKVIEANSSEVMFDADGLQSGMYIVTMVINGKRETYKIIKR